MDGFAPLAMTAMSDAGPETLVAVDQKDNLRLAIVPLVDDPQRGAYLHTGPEELYARYGFTRDRKIAKWRWVMRTQV